MQIQSTRFGAIEIAEDAVIEFAEGIIGLPGNRYALIVQHEGSSFYWLHSVDDPSVALPVTQPWQFFPTYGPVGAAKALLEHHIRSLAVELAPHGVTANAICAGVTDTPALRKIPSHELMLDLAKRRNPSKRLTEPRDIAEAIVALAGPETAWLTGNTIFVVGSEALVG